jgi:nitrogen fixation negative regulator NifL
MAADFESPNYENAALERKQLQAFFTLSDDMMCVVSANGHFTKVNPAFMKFSGYSESELLETPYLDFLFAEDRAKTESEILVALQNTGSYFIKTRFRCKDGVIRKLSWQLDSDAELGVLYAIGRYVTDIHATEEQQRLLCLAVQQSSQSVVITDLSARIEYANEASSTSSGYTNEELIGSNQRLLQSGRTPSQAYAEMWQTLERGEVWQGVFNNRRKNGEIYIESARISPVRQPDGRITHYLAIKEDITEQKLVMDGIRESKALLQAVIDAIPDWIYVKDSQHRFLLVNGHYAKAFDLTPAQMVGHPDSEFIPSRLRFSSDDAGVEQIHDDDDIVFSGQSIHHPHDSAFLANGEVRFFDTYKRPMRDSSQRIYGNLCYQRDITERFNKQQEQAQLEKQLHQAQKMELIGHLTGGIAHDFNNILSAVFGYAELMMMSPDVENSQPLKEYLKEILQAGIRAKELVSQLLAFSSRRESVSEAISVIPIMKEVVKMLRSTVPATISIKCEVDHALPKILISPVRLNQVLLNLGVNARDAIEGIGEIHITAEPVLLRETCICASCHQNFTGEYLMISVLDSGSGIPADNLMRIFDPFFTTKEVGRGSGLGLSVLHGIVHSASGHILVKTELGQGTEFRIYLPAHTSRGLHQPSEVEPESRHSPVRGHVMVVDDDAIIVKYMTVLLEKFGCQVTGMTSATEALRMFQDNPRCVDLVMTDQTMPALSGIELARAMLACRPDIPIVLSTGYSNVIDEDIVRQSGIRRFLTKPVPAKVLADIVAEYLAVRVSEHPEG